MTIGEGEWSCFMSRQVGHPLGAQYDSEIM